MDDFDDRVQCQNCLFFKQEVVTQRMPLQDWDRLVRVNHPAHQWMFDLVKINAGWAAVTYARKACHGGEPAPMPADLKHRCNYFSKLNDDDHIKPQHAEKIEKDWWE
jgi:hypothetical protein